MEADHLTLSTEHLSLGLNPTGLTFDSLVVNSSTSDDTRDVLVGFENIEDYRQRLFFGSTVGRYANRLPAGETRLKSGASISLTGGSSDSVCLHGGPSGFDTLPWTRLTRSESTLFPSNDPSHPIPAPPSDPKAPTKEASQVFRLYSPAGVDGFPCTLEIEALVSVEAPKEDGLGQVKIVLRSKIKEDGDTDIEKGTPVNLTVHWGFRLDDCSEPDILSHSLFIDSNELVSLDEKGLSTGSIDKIPRNGQGLDYSNASEHRLIGHDYPQGGIDRNFLFNPSPSSSSSSPLSTSPQVILTAPSSSSQKRLQLSFSSSLPSVQIYSAPGLDGSGPLVKPAHQRSQEEKKGYSANGALFIEFQQPVGTLSHTCAESAREGNELEEFLRKRWEERGGEEKRSWEKDSLVRRGMVWESWVEVEVKTV